jgi:hypothetical protein
MIAPNQPTAREIRDQFVAFLPELSSRLSNRFRFRNPEAKEDAIAEAVAFAWTMYLSVKTGGRTVTVGNLAFYAGRLVDSGRKVAGTTSTDALSDCKAARQKTPEHVSLDALGDACPPFYAVFGDRRWRWPILDYVAPNLDWRQFETRCSRRDKQIIRLKRAGWRQTEIASRLGISPPAVNQRLRNLKCRWKEMSMA